MKWVITKANDMRIEVTDPTGGTVVSLRLDDDETSGCTHYYSYYNGAGRFNPREDDTEYLHICDLSEFLAELHKLDELRKAVKRGEIGVSDCPHECIAHGRAAKWCQACGEIFEGGGSDRGTLVTPKLEAVIAEARKGCWCETTRKPCGYHEGLIDGTALVEDYINTHFDEMAAALQTPEPLFDARTRLDMALSVAFGIADQNTEGNVNA